MNCVIDIGNSRGNMVVENAPCLENMELPHYHANTNALNIDNFGLNGEICSIIPVSFSNEFNPPPSNTHH